MKKDKRTSPNLWGEREAIRRYGHSCPICQTQLPFIKSHPNFVCRACAAKVTDVTGRRLIISNKELHGGYLARYEDSGDSYDNQVCYIEGIKCTAQEVRMGGIAIEKYIETEAAEGKE